MVGEQVDHPGITRSETGRTTYFPGGHPPQEYLDPRYSEHTLAPPQVEKPLEMADDYDDGKASKDELHGSRRRSTSSSTIASESDLQGSTHNSALAPPVETTRSRTSRISRMAQEDSLENVDLEKQPSQTPNQHQEPSDPNLIEWDGPNDPENPMNFPRWRKWMITIVLGFATFCITFASSVFSTATQVTAEQFGVSNEVMVLGTSLFVLVSRLNLPMSLCSC